jgi:hypothetical protein
VGDVHDRVHVPGQGRQWLQRHRYGSGAAQAEKEAASNSTSPRRDRSRTASCWYAKAASGGGRRAASGLRCAVQEARRTSMLAGREGYISEGPNPHSLAAGCRGMGAGVTSQGCAPGL